jgi:hypothetical protein
LIKMYGAGNFVLMSNPEKEKKFVEEVTKRTGSCSRLISFFFKKELQTILTVKELGNED